MKLRLRFSESNQTLKIEIPNASSLRQLKDAVSQKLSVDSSSVRLSLNKKEDLESGHSPDSPVSSLGLTSGDLVFYNLVSLHSLNSQIVVQNPSCQETGILDAERTPAIPNSEENSIENPNSEKTPILDVLNATENPNSENTLIFSERNETELDSSMDVDSYCDLEEEEEEQNPTSKRRLDEIEGNPNSGELDISSAGSHEERNSNSMNIDDDEPNDEKKLISVSGFLMKVFYREFQDYREEGDLMLIAVHAVMLESGFVAFSPVDKCLIERYCMPRGWAVGSVSSICYTVDDLLNDGEPRATVTLKFMKSHNSLVVYGSLDANSSNLSRVYLNALDYVSSIRAVVEKAQYSDELHYDKKVFELWKLVKDGLSLPLLHELCAYAGLDPPSSLLVLPTELKMKIFELLPGVDLAKIGCVCVELRYLSSNDDLWKMKHEQEFGSGQAANYRSWRSRYIIRWKDRKLMTSRRRLFTRHRLPQYVTPHPYPNPFLPGIIIQPGRDSAFPEPFGIGGGISPLGTWQSGRHRRRSVIRHIF